MSSYYVYILASRRNGTLYVGFTSDLLRRVHAHKSNFVEGFTRKYGVHTLVYFEQCGDREGAIQREKQIKEWKRRWKMELIEKVNPEWKDLYEQILLEQHPYSVVKRNPEEDRLLDSDFCRNGYVGTGLTNHIWTTYEIVRLTG